MTETFTPGNSTSASTSASTSPSASASTEIAEGDRFAFGDNWRQFLDLVDEDRIQAAVESLVSYLGKDDLTGLRFLDIGSGSGLFSLAAHRLGATVVSFDFDPSSVACTAEMRRRYAGSDDTRWEVGEGSVLDADFLASLGTFDVVYSWGVLHHTGSMWEAIDLATTQVAPGGLLFISIYNDQGSMSRRWTTVKRTYNQASPAKRKAILTASRMYFTLGPVVHTTYRVLRRLPAPGSAPRRRRGMDRERDLVDWVGGWPFEVAKPEEVFDFCHERGFQLAKMTTCRGGLGCNEFVFVRD